MHKILLIFGLISLLLFSGCVSPLSYNGISGITVCGKLCIEEGMNFDSQTISTCKCSKIILKSDINKSVGDDKNGTK